MKKRILSWLLSAAMAVTMAPVTTYAGQEKQPEAELFTDNFKGGVALKR